MNALHSPSTVNPEIRAERWGRAIGYHRGSLPTRNTEISTLTWIIKHNDAAAAGPERLGGKAGALAALKRAHLPIPEWIALSPSAFTDSLTQGQRATLARAADGAALTALMQRVRPSAAVIEEIEAALAALCPGGERVAVRSSALDEDGAQHSFAGQLDSFLFVLPEDVPDRVVAVWRSGFSDRILAYRREHGLSPMPSPPAVLIQRMAKADASGVAFSVDPVTGDQAIAVVAAVYGIGTALVSGESDADTYSVDREGTIVRRSVAHKTSAHHFDSEGESGVRTVPIPEVLADRPAITDDQVQEIAWLARTAARRFGRPQDIEWAVEKGTVYLLQSRPITSLAGMVDPNAALALWDNSNIAESYSGITTPLTFSFARRAYEEVYRQFLRILSVPEDAIADNDETLKRMLGLIRGRIYYNLGNWYRVLALLPGYTLNREFMEQMMGVREPIPDGLLPKRPPAAGLDRLRDAARLTGMVVGLWMSHRRLPASIKAFHARLDDALAEGPIKLPDMRADELAAEYRKLERRLLTSWDAPLVNDFFAMIAYGLLGRLLDQWCAGKADGLRNDLLSGQSGIISAEPARLVRELGEIAREDPKFVDILQHGTLDQILDSLGDQRDFQSKYDAYLAKFGDRCISELKLESLTLEDNPLPLLRSAGQFAGREKAEKAPAADRSIAVKAEERVRKLLERQPVREYLYDIVLRGAQGRIRDRENLRFERTRLFGRVRRIFLEIGRRFAAAELLAEPRDVFYLEVGEVLGFIEGTATSTDFKGLVSLRRAEYLRYESMPAPSDRFETRGMVSYGNTYRPARKDGKLDSGATAAAPGGRGDSGKRLTGIGCSPGVVCGPIRKMPCFVPARSLSPSAPTRAGSCCSPPRRACLSSAAASSRIRPSSRARWASPVLSGSPELPAGSPTASGWNSTAHPVPCVKSRRTSLRASGGRVRRGGAIPVARNPIRRRCHPGKTGLPVALNLLGSEGTIHYYTFASRNESVDDIRMKVQDVIQRAGRTVRSFSFADVIREIAPGRVHVAMDVLIR